MAKKPTEEAAAKSAKPNEAVTPKKTTAKKTTKKRSSTQSSTQSRRNCSGSRC